MTQIETIIEKMSLKEMKEAKTVLDSAIRVRETQEKEKFLSQMQEQAQSLGLELGDLLGEPAQLPTVLTLPRYVNPENPSETWHGIGKQPDWLRYKIEEEGRNRKEFLSDHLSEEQIRKIAAASVEK